MVTDPLLIAFFYGFVPAMGLIYILLKEYHEFLHEKRIFRTFFLGLLFGLLGTILEQVLQGPLVASARESTGNERAGIFLLTAGLLGLLEALMFTAFLNWKSYRGRRDTPFYGVAFGLGFGATNTIFFMGAILDGIDTAGGRAPVFEEVFLLTIFGLFFVGSILAYAAMGAWIGQGTGVGPLMPFVGRAALIRAGYFAVLLFLFLYAERYPAAFVNALGVGGAVAGVVLVHQVVTRLLDRVVPPEILREMGIHNRRLARQVVRAEEETQEPPLDQTNLNRPGRGS